eukprot:g12494.t1
MEEDLAHIKRLEKSIKVGVREKQLRNELAGIVAKRKKDKKTLKQLKYKRLKKYGIIRLKETAPSLFAHVIEFISDDVKCMYSVLVSSMLKQFTENMDTLSKVQVKKTLKRFYINIEYHPEVVAYKEEQEMENQYYLKMLLFSKLLPLKIYNELSNVGTIKRSVKSMYSPRISSIRLPKIPLLEACEKGKFHDVRFLIEHYHMAKFTGRYLEEEYCTYQGEDERTRFVWGKYTRSSGNDEFSFTSVGDYVNQFGTTYSRGFTWPHENSNYNNALYICAEKQHVDIVKYLLEIPGIDLEANSDNRTALFIAAEMSKNPTILELLLNHEACTKEAINVVDNFNGFESYTTALDILLVDNPMPAATKKPLIRLFRSKGAKRGRELPEYDPDRDGRSCYHRDFPEFEEELLVEEELSC